jgi:hypothetical protein
MNPNHIGLASAFIEVPVWAMRMGYRPSLLDVMANVASLVTPKAALEGMWEHLTNLPTTEVRELPWWLATFGIGLLALLWPLTWVLFVPLHWALCRQTARHLDQKKEHPDHA